MTQPGSTIGYHFIGSPSNHLDLIRRAPPTVVKLLDWDSPEDILALYAAGVQFVVLRLSILTLDLDYHQAWAADLAVARLPEKVRNLGVLFEFWNEPRIDCIEDAQTLNAVYTRLAQLLPNEKVLAYSCSTGNPQAEFAYHMQAGAAACWGVGQHLYFNKEAGFSMLNAPATLWGKHRVVGTEHGWDRYGGRGDGWRGDPKNGIPAWLTEDEYLDMLDEADNHLRAFPNYVGSAIYQEGGGGAWESFALGASLMRRLTYRIEAKGGGKVFEWKPNGNGGTVEPTFSIKVTPPSIPAGQSAVIEIFGEGLLGGWLSGGEFLEKPLAPVNGHTETVRPTQTTTYTLRVLLPNNVSEYRTATLTVTGEPEPLYGLPAWVTIRHTNGAHWHLRDAWAVENAATCNIYVLTERGGKPFPNVKVTFMNGGETPQRTEMKDSQARTDFPQSGDSNFDPNSPDPARRVGPYSVRVGNGMEDVASGMGLPLKRHWEYWLVFEWREEVEPPPDSDPALEAAIAASKSVTAYLESLRK